MLSKGRLSKALPIKVSGQFETKVIEQDGPIAFLESGSQTNIFNEDANRCILLRADESPEQTQHILMTMANVAAGSRLVEDKDTVQRHHALQRLLKTYTVVVPYAEQLAARFPHDCVEVRRAFQHVLSMIEASALLHQRQRDVDGQGRLVANADDYALTRRLLAEPLARQLQGRLSAGSLALLRQLIEWFGERRMNFTVAEVIRKLTGSTSASSSSSVYQRIGELSDSGLLDKFGGHAGQRSARYQVASAAADYSPVLPPVHEVCGVYPRNSEDND
jgi:hypothetical protein